MGLSSKQVSIDGFDWSKALLQAQKLELPKLPSSGGKRSPANVIPALEPLKCPRCDSMNTKFCYYNNYNKSQPRHFCRSCKRHWTKGGTLRNVPVGGGRKNKRLKKLQPEKSTAPGAGSGTSAGVRNPQTRSTTQDQNLPVGDILYQGLVFPPLQSFKASNIWSENTEDFNRNYGVLNSSQTRTQGDVNPNFSAVSSSTSYETKQSPISSSFPSSSFCDYSDQDLKPLEMEGAIGTRVSSHPWQLPTTTSCFWSWDDEIDPFAATDLNIPWDDDKEIKP